MSNHIRSAIVRVVTPALLVLFAGLEISVGGDSLPAWLNNAAVKTGAGSLPALRVLIAAQLAAAAFAVLYRRAAPAIAWITFIGTAFIGLADLSTVFNMPGKTVLPVRAWLVPLIAVAVGGIGIWLLNATAPRAGSQTTGPKAPITAWRVILAVVIAGAALGIAGRLPLEERGKGQFVNGIENIDLDTESWVGKTIPGTGLARHIPQITPLTLEGTKWIVFYNPTCGRCHDVFATYFAGGQNFEVIAIEVPHAPGEELLPTDQPREIECKDCNRFSLPVGPRWLVTTPTIVKIENGIVTCTTHIDYDRCRKATDTVE